MIRYLIKFVLVVLLSMVTGLASAASWYVLQGATGRNDGSDWTNAYTALPSSLNRGDTYYVGAGTYSGRTFSTAASGTSLIAIKKATATDHGTDVGWNAAFGTGQAKFSSGFAFTSPYWLVDGQVGGGAATGWNQSFGFVITEKGDSNPVVNIGQSGGKNANNITIRHVELVGKGSVSSAGGGYSNDGLAIWDGPANITLSYFWMHGIGRCPFFMQPNDTVIEHGWVQSFFGSSAVHSEVASIWAIGSGSVGNVTFRHNLITDIESTGGIMWDNSTNNSAFLYVYGNVFYKPTGASWGQANGVIGGWTGNNGEQFRNALVYNNTFVNVDQESLSSFPNIFSGNVAYNNLFYNSDSPTFEKFPTHDYNYFINSGGTHSEANGTSAASGDPFVNFVGLDFRLKAQTAPGKALPAPFNVDALGRVRGSSGAVSRGAFEYDGAVSSTLAPPTSLTVQ